MLVVLPTSDAFSDYWPQLAQHVGSELVVMDHRDATIDLRAASAVLVAAGGAEGGAPDVVRRARTAGADSVSVVGTAGDYRIVLALCRAGAAGYFAVPDDLSALRAWVTERVEHRRASHAREGEETQRGSDHFAAIVGKSPVLRAALDEAQQVIPRGEVTVLITGETGTGKELLAQAIHRGGPRAPNSFVEVNCAALPTPLMESELFGYERGAFAEARTAKAGLLEIARGGTLYLDEVAEMPLEMQAKLLRVLDTRRVRRVGGLRETEIDVRVIAATNADLSAAVAAGRFREDLLYRLAVVTLRLPPLRSRGNDILLLARHFLDLFGRQYQVQTPPLSPDARKALSTHRWPGNVRELKNAVERAVVLSEGCLDHFGPCVAGLSPAHAAGAPLPFPATLDRIARAAARETLERFDGNKSEAARILGITRKHLYTLLAHSGGGSEVG